MLTGSGEKKCRAHSGLKLTLNKRKSVVRLREKRNRDESGLKRPMFHVHLSF